MLQTLFIQGSILPYYHSNNTSLALELTISSNNAAGIVCVIEEDSFECSSNLIQF